MERTGTEHRKTVISTWSQIESITEALSDFRTNVSEFDSEEGDLIWQEAFERLKELRDWVREQQIV